LLIKYARPKLSSAEVVDILSPFPTIFSNYNLDITREIIAGRIKAYQQEVVGGMTANQNLLISSSSSLLQDGQHFLITL